MAVPAWITRLSVVSVSWSASSSGSVPEIFIFSVLPSEITFGSAEIVIVGLVF